MSKQNMTFDLHKLEVDFLTLSMENLSNKKKIDEFANYLFKNFGFNSFLSEGKTRRITKILCQDVTTSDTLIIRINYWNVTVLEFPGKSAQKLYQLLKSGKINWRFFPTSSLKLTRFDLRYQLIKNQFFDSQEFDNFLLESRDHILKRTKTRNVKLINDNKGVILGINKRSNSRYIRVYETPNAIRFELESKNSALKNLEDFLFNYQFNLLEASLTPFYFYYIQKFFPLENFFVSWVIDFIRKNPKSPTNTEVGLASEYFMDITSVFDNQSHVRVYHLLQFLNFIKTLKKQEYTFEDSRYYISTFALKDFLNFIGLNKNQKQRVTTIEYFKQLHQNDPIIKQFQDGSFRIYATFLYSQVYKKSNRWFVRVYIHEALYQYAYPFMLPRSFRNYKNKTDCFLKLKIIQAVSVRVPTKVFNLSIFLKNLKLSNQKIVNVKQDLILLIQEAIQQGIIQSKLGLVYKNGNTYSLEHHELTVKHFNRRVKHLVFYEKLHK